MAAKKKRRRRNMTALQRQYFGGGKRKSNPVRRRRRRSAARAAAPRRRRRRRNPMGFSVTGLLARLQQGGYDAACVVAGKTGVRLVSSQFDQFPYGTVVHGAIEVASAIGLSLVAEQVLGRERARFVLAGGLASTLEEFINKAEIPVISPLLGATPNANTGVIYAAADGPRMGSWSGKQLGSWSGPSLARRGAGAAQQPLQSPALLQS